ncbi:MAG: hypothetical protein K6T83_18660 [Alicyclobacillus sp.]|nr:hypothetical protein [Alicyclobacillus sp.]
MYRPTERQMLLPDEFFLPFGGKNNENRWVKLAQMIPWWKVEEHYGERFYSSTKGQEAYSVRVDGVESVCCPIRN